MMSLALAVAVVIGAVPSVDGSASWYCSESSDCPRGYGPNDLVAAIDRKDTPWDKGDRLIVRHGDRQVIVRIVDVCGCPGRRIIDLTSGAFSRLAPLWRGVIPVTVTEYQDVPLPATDTIRIADWRHR